MKLRYFIPSLVAVVAAMFTGCNDDKDPTYLSEIRVSQSYRHRRGDAVRPPGGGSLPVPYRSVPAVAQARLT